MRRIVLLLALVLMAKILTAQARTLTVNLEKQPIAVLLKEIKAQCGYNFVYSDEVVADTVLVSVNAKNLSVAEVLNKLLPDKELGFHIVSDKLIVINALKRKVNSTSKTTTLEGVILDPGGKPIPYASIALLDALQPVGGSISTEEGRYTLSHNFLPQHRYLLKITSIGYQPATFEFSYPDTAGIKRIVLSEEKNTLQAVQVSGTKPLIERKADRFIVNVEDSYLGIGNTGLEVLEKSPGLWVDANGNIKIRGNQEVMVMINNVVQRMSSADLAEYLRTLKSEDISKIEIISNPPSEFEAAGSGGIVHIILKRARADGLVGSVSASYRQQERQPDYGYNASLNYKVKKLYFSASLSAGREKSEYFASNKITYPNQDRYVSGTDRYNNNKRLFYRFGLNYDLDARQSIGLQSLNTAAAMNQFFETGIAFAGSQTFTGNAKSEWIREPTLNNLTLNYALKTDSLGSGLIFITDYVHSKKAELNNFASEYSLAVKNSVYRNNTPNTTNLYSLQTDYTQVLNKTLSLKAGLKFAGTERDNEVINEQYISGSWILNTNLSNRFVYKENLSMAYASLEKRWKLLNIKGGLRAEHTHMNGNSVTANTRFTRNFLRLFPSVFIAQKLKEENGATLYFNYSRRLQRPAFADLNPYRLKFDDYLTKIGNPDLAPEYTQKIAGGVLFPKGTSLELYYSHTSGKIAELANPVAGNIIEYQTTNFKASKEFGFSLDAPLRIYQWWNMYHSFAGYNLRYTLNNFAVRQTTFFVQSQQNISLKKLFDIDLNASYRSPYVQANTHVAYQFSVNGGLSKRFYNNKLALRFSVGDIFNTSREQDYTEYANTRIDFYQKRPTRNFFFRIGYNFSAGKKFSDKKIEQSNEDEKRRIGN